MSKRMSRAISLWGLAVLAAALLLAASCIDVEHSGEIGVDHNLDIYHDINGDLDINLLHEVTMDDSIEVAHSVKGTTWVIVDQIKSNQPDAGSE